MGHTRALLNLYSKAVIYIERAQEVMYTASVLFFLNF